MGHNASYLYDLERCARRVYELRADAMRQRSRRRTERIFDHDRRVVIGLAGQLIAAIVLAPWLGAGAVLAGLAILYVGALVSTAWTLRRLKRADAGRRAGSVDAAVKHAVATCPPLTGGAAAVVVRLANLTAISPTTRSVAMLRAALHEAEAHPELRAWPFLAEVAALVDGPLGQPAGAEQATSA